MYGYLRPTDSRTDWVDVPRWEIDKLATIEHRRFVAANPREIAVTYKHSGDIKTAIETVDKCLSGYAERCQAESQVVDYLDRLLTKHYHRGLSTIARSMETCHKNGTQAVVEATGKSVTLWDHKCGVTRLCPHEGRNETHRIIERYLPAIEKNLEPFQHRAYSCVFTLPNYPAGKLKQGMTDIYARFKRLLKKRKDVVGALCVVECPLSVHGDWNVHLNCILITNGWLDYQAVRRQWYWDVQINALENKSSQALSDTLKEVIKYAVKLTPDKSAEKAANEKTKAPALIEWPHELFLEWWAAHNGYRRVRSYGGLYLTKARREKLGLESVEVRSLDPDSYTIIGRVEFVQDRYLFTPADFSLDLIREDKSISTSSNQGQTGPPNPH